MSVRQQRFRNTWCAVYINKEWRFVNCKWAARRLTAKQTHSHGLQEHESREGIRNSLSYGLDTFYFMTPPKLHIYEHFPDDPHWQLLAQPISLSQFEKLPPAKSPFFTRGFSFRSPTSAELQKVAGDRYEVSFSSSDSTPATAVLERIDGGRMNTSNVVTSLCAGRVSVTCLEPLLSGQYLVKVYAASHHHNIDESLSTWDLACTFTLTHVAASACSPGRLLRSQLPPLPYIGLTPAGAGAQLSTCSHHKPLINCNTPVQLLFELPPDASGDLCVLHSLQLYDPIHNSYTDYHQSAMLRAWHGRTETPPNTLTSTIADRHAETSGSRCTNTSMGRGSDMNNTAANVHTDKLMETATNKRGIRHDGRHTDAVNNRKQGVESDVIDFQVCAPKSGVYVFNVLAAHKTTNNNVKQDLTGQIRSCDPHCEDDDSTNSRQMSYVPLYIMSLDVRRAHTCRPFPRYGKGWRGCTLYSPLLSCLPCANYCEFCLETRDNVQEVVLCDAGECLPLRRDSCSRWKATYRPQSPGAKVKLYSRVAGHKYQPLLEYDVM